METLTFYTSSYEETMTIGSTLANLLKGGEVLTLEGDLGAGKTTFTKGIAKGLGIKRTVNSPTFTIIKEYQGKIPLYHMDVYRLEESDEDLGFDEYFYGNGITIVEWAHFIKESLPEDLLKVEMVYDGENRRVITFKPKGEKYIELCKELKEYESTRD